MEAQELAQGTHASTTCAAGRSRPTSSAGRQCGCTVDCGLRRHSFFPSTGGFNQACAAAGGRRRSSSDAQQPAGSRCAAAWPRNHLQLPARCIPGAASPCSRRPSAAGPAPAAQPAHGTPPLSAQGRDGHCQAADLAVWQRRVRPAALPRLGRGGAVPVGRPARGGHLVRPGRCLQGLGIGNAAETRFCRRSPPAALSETPLRPVHRASHGPWNMIAMTDRVPALPAPARLVSGSLASCLVPPRC